MDYNNFIPGFAMGITRAIVSHPFEILKIKSQLNKKELYKNLFRGLHYSVISNGLSRSVQFYFYDYFLNNSSNLISSAKASVLSTIVELPYSYLMVNKSVQNNKLNINLLNISKTIPLEFTRSILGSTIFLYTYNELKDKKYPLWLCAFGGTTTVWSLTYPLDNLRNQIISNNKLNILKLYNGVQYPILRSIPSSIIGMYVYEKTKEYIV